MKNTITNSNVSCFFFLWLGTQKYCIICFQQVYNCTQCKASSNVAYFSLPLMIKWQVLQFYTSKVKLLPGTVFLMSEYLYDYDMHSMTSLHILFVQIFIKIKKMYTLLLSVKEECCLLKISTWIMHFAPCKKRLWKLIWRDFHSSCSVQQNPISRQFKPLQFISEGNQLSM